jgi:uncharacterized protein YkwD
MPVAVFTNKLIHTPTDAPRKLPGKLPTAKRPGASTNLAQDVLRLTNELRARGGNCGGRHYNPSRALLWDTRLANSAMRHAQAMAHQDFFNHVSPQGLTPEQRIQQAGWTSLPIGENIAAGQATAQEVMQGWIDSPGHCANLHRPQYTHIGIAYYYDASSKYKHYWVQNFGG